MTLARITGLLRRLCALVAAVVAVLLTVPAPAHAHPTTAVHHARGGHRGGRADLVEDEFRFAVGAAATITGEGDGGGRGIS